MCFDVPKVVRSIGCDHGHDEESRNGRDIKIDILEAYICLDIRMIPSGSCIFPEYREVIGTPQEKLWALWAIRGKHTSPQGASAPPLGRSLIRTRRRGPSPLSFSFSLPPFLLRVGGGILLGLGGPSRTPHLGTPPRAGCLSLSLLYIRRLGAPQRHTSCSLAVCGAPLHSFTPRSYCRSA